MLEFAFQLRQKFSFKVSQYFCIHVLIIPPWKQTKGAITRWIEISTEILRLFIVLVQLNVKDRHSEFPGLI